MSKSLHKIPKRETRYLTELMVSYSVHLVWYGAVQCGRQLAREARPEENWRAKRAKKENRRAKRAKKENRRAERAKNRGNRKLRGSKREKRKP